jgi:transposase
MLNEGIKKYDERMEKIAKAVYAEVSLLKQVKGVGTQIALTYLLTIEDPQRFLKSREVGCLLGLRPALGNSGQSKPQKDEHSCRHALESLASAVRIRRRNGKAHYQHKVTKLRDLSLETVGSPQTSL